MTRQNLFSDLWDGENEEDADPASSLLAAGQRQVGSDAVRPGTGRARDRGSTCTSESRRCSSSSAVAPPSGARMASEELAPGDYVFCPEGRAGLHVFSNPTDEPARILAMSAGSFPDVVAYPEHGYAWVATRDPDPELLAQGGDPGIIARFEIPVE